MSKTVKEHLEECKQVSDVIESANALLKKVQAELAIARAVLEELREYQHPKLTMPHPYQLDRSKTSTPKSLIELEIDRINTLLGDRA